MDITQTRQLIEGYTFDFESLKYTFKSNDKVEIYDTFNKTWLYGNYQITQNKAVEVIISFDIKERPIPNLMVTDSV